MNALTVSLVSSGATALVAHQRRNTRTPPV